MFYKKYLTDLMMQLKKDSNKKISNLNEIINDYDKNAGEKWELMQRRVNELTEKHNLLVNAFNEQRNIITKIIAKLNKKSMKETKKKGK